MSKFGYLLKTGIFLIYYRRSLLAVRTEIAVTVARRSPSRPFDLLHQILVRDIAIFHRTNEDAFESNISITPKQKLLLPIHATVNHRPLIQVLAEDKHEYACISMQGMLLPNWYVPMEC